MRQQVFGSAMEAQFDEMLEEAAKRQITKEEALWLFQETKGTDRTLKLFETACKVRETEAGNKVKLMGFIASITRCTTDPACKYCFKWANPDAFTQKDVLDENELADAAKAIEGAGVKHVELGGGTLWGEEGTQTTLKALEAVANASKLGVWINNGPSFTPDDVFKFKESGAEGIACNLESICEVVYQKMRPGDSLSARKAIIEATDRAGLGIDNTLMVGLGDWEEGVHPYQDWVDFLFYFKQFKNFRILEAHPFRPVPRSPVENLPAGSSLEAAKAKAIARLVFRNIDIAGADEMVGLMAGANQIMHAVSVTHARRTRPGISGGKPEVVGINNNLELHNYLPVISRHLKEFGMELE